MQLTDFNPNSKVSDLYCACAQPGMIVQLSLSPQASCNNPRKQKIFLRTWYFYFLNFAYHPSQHHQCQYPWVPEYQSLLQLTISLYIRISVTVLRNILGLTIGPISVTVLSNTKMLELDLYILLDRWCKATPNPYT